MLRWSQRPTDLASHLSSKSYCQLDRGHEYRRSGRFSQAAQRSVTSTILERLRALVRDRLTPSSAHSLNLKASSPDIDEKVSHRAHQRVVHDTLQQIDLVHSLVAAFPQRLHYTPSADDVWRNFHSSKSISSLLGAEGLHQIGDSASVLRMYYRLGVRYVTLTHDCHNRYADSAAPASPLHHGISSAGVAMLHEMNRIGMMIDLSHTSADTMRMAVNASAAPVIFSHSSSYSLCPHPRNVPDDILFAVKDNDGIIMVTFVREYLNCQNPDEASLADVADHIDYIGKLIGFRHVGIGGDFDGMARGPRGLEDVSKYPDLIHELHRRGLSGAEIAGVVGANVLRVLADVESVAHQMSGESPLEDDVENMREIF